MDLDETGTFARTARHPPLRSGIARLILLAKTPLIRPPDRGHTKHVRFIFPPAKTVFSVHVRLDAAGDRALVRGRRRPRHHIRYCRSRSRRTGWCWNALVSVSAVVLSLLFCLC